MNRMQLDWRLLLGGLVVLVVLAASLYHSTARVEKKLNRILALVGADTGSGRGDAPPPEETPPPKTKRVSFDV